MQLAIRTNTVLIYSIGEIFGSVKDSCVKRNVVVGAGRCLVTRDGKCKQLPQINRFVDTFFMAMTGCGLLTHIQGCLQFFLRITVLIVLNSIFLIQARCRKVSGLFYQLRHLIGFPRRQQSVTADVGMRDLVRTAGRQSCPLSCQPRLPGC